MVKMFKLITGEFVVTKISDLREDGGYVLEYPLNIIPIPQQQGGQPQIGFSKFMPFSDSKKPIVLLSSAIAVDSDADNNITAAYEQQITQLRAKESGIIMPNQSIPKEVLKDAAAQDFNSLRT
jgi:hypothetical protein